MVQKYRNGGQTVAMGANKVAYVEGRCVGGGSEINSGLYHRTPPDILETWRREFRVDGLTEEELRPHFEACEKDVSVSLLPGPAPAASLKTCTTARRDWDGNPLEVPRWFRYDARATEAPMGNGRSMTETFVPRLLESGRHNFCRQTRVDTIRQEGGKWIIDAQHTRGGRNSHHGGELVCLCGVRCRRPRLLRRSGMTRNIGNSLRLHPTVKVVAKFPDAVNSAQMGVPVHQVKEFAPRFSFGCSISTPPYLALALLRSSGASAGCRADWPRHGDLLCDDRGRRDAEQFGCCLAFRDPLVRYRLDRAGPAGPGRGIAETLPGAFRKRGATALLSGRHAQPGVSYTGCSLANCQMFCLPVWRV